MALEKKPAEIFAANLRREMRTRDLTQAELASLAGIQQPHVSRILRALDDLRLSTMSRVAAALEVPLVVLLVPVEVDSADEQVPAGVSASAESSRDGLAF